MRVWLASLSPRGYEGPTYRMCHLTGMSLSFLSPTRAEVMMGYTPPGMSRERAVKHTTQPRSSHLLLSVFVGTCFS